MRILYFSDIHIDVGKFILDLPDESLYDIIVIGGDISSDYKKTAMFMEQLQKRTTKPVFFVPGNHDRWHTSFDLSEAVYQKIPGYLNRKVVEINGERILGLTLWYYTDKSFHRNSWSDLMYIQDYTRIEEEHYLDKEFLINNLREGDIVISHMMPLYDVVSPRWRGSEDNKFFVNDIPEIVFERNPKLWIHGHSHDPIYTKINKTLFIRNPRGYPGEASYRYFVPEIIDTETL